jgi:hypothetical protein
VVQQNLMRNHLSCLLHQAGQDAELYGGESDVFAVQPYFSSFQVDVEVTADEGAGNRILSVPPTVDSSSGHLSPGPALGTLRPSSLASG